MAIAVSPNSQGLPFCNTHGTFFFFGCFSPLGHTHGNENHFQFTALHIKAMGFIKFINQRKSHERCGGVTLLLVEG